MFLVLSNSIKELFNYLQLSNQTHFNVKASKALYELFIIQKICKCKNKRNPVIIHE